MLLVGIGLFSSCSPTKRLAGHKLLVDNQIVIDTDATISRKSVLKKELQSLIKQEPNGTFMFFPSEQLPWTKPVGYEPEAVEETVSDMQNYLRNKKGYYYAEVTSDSLTDEHSIEIIYNIKTNSRYKIGDITYHGVDQNILNEIQALKPNALLKKEDPIDAGLFDLELSRITLALQNKGYANFAANYFKIRGDSSTVDQKVDIYFEVLPPLPDSSHTRFTIGDINVYTDFKRGQPAESFISEIFDAKSYKRISQRFLVKPSVINNMIFLKKGDIYSRDNRTKTFRKLSGLGTYKFATISPSVSAQSDSILNYDIFLTPHKYKWVADYGSELFYNTVNQNSSQLFGVSLSTLFKNRNFLGGGEQFTIGSETGMEIQLNPFLVSTINLALNTNLEIPKQVDLFNTAKVLKNIGILPKSEYQRFREETTTNIGLGFNFINILDTRSITSASAKYTYDYKRGKNSRFLITTFGVDLNIYDLKQPIISEFLLNSFENNLITGFLFKDITYLHTTPVNQNGLSKYLILSFEASGWEKSILNTIYNGIAGSDSDWMVDSLSFSRYLRLEADRRWYQRIGDNSELAFRLHGGIIVPFGNDISAPFVRQFSIGGPNSLRAWDQRELGPGGYATALERPVLNQTYFQQGDVKLEFSIEYRFPVIYLLKGALFFDGGNVWTLREDVDRPRSQFSGDFLDQIALGFGYGLRWDFNYFNIRFDFGYKLRNPYHEDAVGEILQPHYDTRDLSGHWYTWSGIKNQGFGNFQVAINHPF